MNVLSILDRVRRKRPSFPLCSVAHENRGNSGKTAAVSLFFACRVPALLRISAANAVWLADNLREKQRKQR